MNPEKELSPDEDKKESMMLGRVVAVLASIFFGFSLLIWLPLFIVLPMAFDGGAGLGPLVFVLTFLAYPVWGITTIRLIWKHQAPSKEFLIFSIIFLIGFVFSLFFT